MQFPECVQEGMGGLVSSYIDAGVPGDLTPYPRATVPV